MIRVQTAEEGATFEFGVERIGHLALQRILEARPFEGMPEVKHRFYFTGDYGREKLDQEPVSIGIRVEEGTKVRSSGSIVQLLLPAT